MQLLLSKTAKQKLFHFYKEKYRAKSLVELAHELNIPKSTLEKWFYNYDRYLPARFVPEDISHQLEILDKKEKNWGRKKGGQRTYSVLLQKYGLAELTKRRINGGKIASANRELMQNQAFKINVDSPLFLEWYGALLGDGWLSALSYQYKTRKNLWWVGISGHAELDRAYLMHLANIIKSLFGKTVITKYKKGTLGMEIIFCHKPLINFMAEKMNFPIGLKKDLSIETNIANDWEKIKYVTRGLFDTDGCFYFDKTPAKKQYPCINIHMKAPKLLEQLKKQLLMQGYKLMLRDDRIILKGSIQVNRWMTEIGSSNQKHIQKYVNWKKNVPVAQLG